MIWDHRRTLMVRLTNCMTLTKQDLPARAKDKKEVTQDFELLTELDKIANDALMKILMSRRTKSNQSRDLLEEPPSVTGTIALHATSWDWLSPTHKNTARDLEPCVMAIAVEYKYMQQYRPTLLEDKYVGTLRRLFANALQPGIRKVQHFNQAKQLTTFHAWSWWDEIPVPSTIEEPAVILQGIEDSLIEQQAQMRERLALEQEDRDAILKLIAYVMNLPVSLSSSEGPAVISADVSQPLDDLVTVS